MKNILSIKNVSYSYHTQEGETPALTDISFDVSSGSFTCIVGPSGCGKSTLLSLISGLLHPDSGEIYINGCMLIRFTSSIQDICFKKTVIFEWRSVYKIVLLGLETRKMLTSEKKELADKMLETYGLVNFKNVKPSQLSGGMRQRVALIRTLALEPDILLLDEPFSALDYQTRLEVSDDIYKILKEQNKTAILVTHDISEAIAMGDKVIILSARPGRINKIIDITFDNLTDGRTPFKARSSPGFLIISTQYGRSWYNECTTATYLNK